MEPNAEPLVDGGRPDHGPIAVVVGHASRIAPMRWRLKFSKGSAMATLISVLITFVVIILVLYLVNMLPIDSRAKQIVQAIVVIIGILSLLRYLAVF
jgi:hypothetical protein